jgi:DNA ligase (NAD+)
MSKQRIKKIEQVIITLDTLYEQGDNLIHPFTGEIVTDNEYDALKRELEGVHPQSHIFDTVTSSKISAKNKVIHDPPMTSINKCNADTEEEKYEILLKWFIDSFPDAKYLRKQIPDWDDAVSISYKRDGIACSLEYEKGKLVCAGTRSKSGSEGENITDKMKYVEGAPLKLAIPLTCTIRGELDTPISVFEKINPTLKKPKANPRAYTAGAIGLKTAEEMKDRGIHFVAYNIITDEKLPYNTEIDRAIWANKKLGITFVRTEKFGKKKLVDMEEQHRDLDYLVDGIVLSVNWLERQVELGNTGDKVTGNPRAKLAWKFKDQVKKSTVRDIVWQTGRTGNITPVLMIDPLHLEGTTVGQVTAHNLGILQEKRIAKGTELNVIKSGKIIPKIHSVVKPTGGKKATYPNTCPSCHKPTKVEHGDKNTSKLVCTNRECPAQNVRMLNHFLNVLGVKGVAESIILKMMDTGLLQDVGDFYQIPPETLERYDFTERQALLAVANIWMVHEPEQIKDNNKLRQIIEDTSNEKLVVPMNKFFAAFGIDNAGKEAGRILMNTYKDWRAIKNASKADLSNLEGIGPIMAVNIVNFFQENADVVKKVENYFELEVPVSKGKLKGKTFVLSGSLEGGKSKWRAAIESKGGTVKGSVGKSIDYLVAGDGSGSKSDKAKELGVTILDTTELEGILK